MSIDKSRLDNMGNPNEDITVNKDLLKIKDQVRRPVNRKDRNSEMAQIESQLNELTEKVDEIRKNISNGNSSHTKLKKKKEIIYLLKNEGGVTATELSDMIDLSRTRSSEYLNEMRKEGILRSKKHGKKKYYELDV